MLRILLLLLTVVPLAAQISTQPVEGLRQKTVRLVAYVNCTAIPEPGKRIDSAVIIVRNERIVDIGKGLAIPQGADVRDLHGAWVYAGFIDAYVDGAAFGGQAPKEQRNFFDEDEGPNTPQPIGSHSWNQAVRPERKATDQLVISKDAAEEWQRLGITTAGVASHDGIFSGSAAVVLMRQGNANRTVIRDDAYQALSFFKGSSKTPYPSSQMGSIALLRQTFIDADWYARAHDAASKNASLVLPETNTSLATLRSVLAAKTPFVCATTDEHDIMRWNAIAKEFSLPTIMRGSGREFRRLETIAANKPDIILPLSFPDAPDVRDPRNAGNVSLTQLINWYWAADNARLLDSAGCRLMFTADGLKDKSQWLNRIRVCVERGLDTSHALAAMTTNPASILGVGDRVGRIAPNQYANLVITTGNLFKQATTIRTVVVAGKEEELAAPSLIDVRGNWTLSSSIFNRKVSMVVTGSSESPSAVIKVDSVPIPSTFSVSGERVTFTLTLDTLGMRGTTRGLASADSILMNVDLQLPDGSSAQVVMRRDSTLAVVGQSPDTSRPEVRRVLPAFRPLEPFGLDSLPSQETVILTNATIWTNTSAGILKNASVKVSGGKIIGVSEGAAPAGARVIDCTGLHITSGVVDEHSHIAISRGVNEGTHAVTTEVRIGDVLDPDDVNIYRQLAGGVTASHLLHGSANPMGGQLQFIKLRWGSTAEELKVKDAMPTVKFALGENVKQANWGDKFTVRYPQTRMGVEQIMSDAFQAAREYERDMKTADASKLPVRRDLQLDALVEIMNGKRKIHCHSYVQSEILMLMRLVESYGFKVHNFTHILEGYKVAREMAVHGASASSFADWWAYKFEVYDAIPQNPAIMHEQGVLTSVNSDDAEMARRLNQEAAKSIKYGNVSEEDAFKFCTLNPAKQMVADATMGSVEAGKDADIVVWSGNPLSNMSRVERTFVDGREYFSRAADARLRVRDRSLRTFLEQEAMKAIGKGAPSAKGGAAPRRLRHCDDLEDEVAGTHE
ncbi:MAG: amidohydrolase family protein [bacterium]|nr:amidohydrolase family protein [bacterium]